MTVVTSPSDVAHPFTVADLEGMPDDGRRYELIDGELLVSPAPGWAHQEAALHAVHAPAQPGVPA